MSKRRVAMVQLEPRVLKVDQWQRLIDELIVALHVTPHGSSRGGMIAVPKKKAKLKHSLKRRRDREKPGQNDIVDYDVKNTHTHEKVHKSKARRCCGKTQMIQKLRASSQ